MTLKNKAKEVVILLDEHYPQEDKCYLNYTQDYELLFATILSAQCTDDRVNQVTEKLFKKYTSLADFANADIDELELDVLPTGFYKNKARHLKGTATLLIENHGGELPSDIEQLTSLKGVGRKTANVVRGHIFKIQSVVVDTHVKRISKKLGLTKNTDPVKVEFDLMEIIEEDSWIKYNQQVIAHGRAVCTARSPKCEMCFLSQLCDDYNNGLKKNKK